MAAMKLLLSQARRQGLTRPSFPQISRLFSSSSSSDSNPNPPPNESRKKLEPVFYAAKPRDQKSEPSDDSSTPIRIQEDRPSWMREKFPYVKDAPSITPLPEDRVVDEEDRERNLEEMVMERKKHLLFDFMEAIKEDKANEKAKFDEALKAEDVWWVIEKGQVTVRPGFLAPPHTVKKDVKVASSRSGNLIDSNTVDSDKE